MMSIQRNALRRFGSHGIDVAGRVCVAPRRRTPSGSGALLKPDLS
jgi:hypothetical protein